MTVTFTEARFMLRRQGKMKRMRPHFGSMRFFGLAYKDNKQAESQTAGARSLRF
jgi:hypothetical protein